MARRIKRFFVFLFFSLFFSMNSEKEPRQNQLASVKEKSIFSFSFNSAKAKCPPPPPDIQTDAKCEPDDPYCSPASF